MNETSLKRYTCTQNFLPKEMRIWCWDTGSLISALTDVEKLLNVMLIEESKKWYFSPLFYCYRNCCPKKISLSKTETLPDLSL